MATTMPAPPSVRVNTFIVGHEKQSVDHLSKVFIVVEFILGLNRIPVFGDINYLFITLAFVYALGINCGIIYLACLNDLPMFILSVKLPQFMFCCIFGFISWKRMRRYYEELDKFDTEVGGSPRITSEPILIILQSSTISICIITMLIFDQAAQIIPVYLIYNLESHYYGYLLNLLIQRLRLINNYIESSVSNPNFPINSGKVGVNNFKTKVATNNNVAMNKLIDFYHILINAYDLLIDAIKWQFLVMLITSFCYLLIKSYSIALMYIYENTPFMDTLPELGLALTELVPLLAPCLCCDQVRAEVRRLRELLASRLYENKIDKSSRSIARALLALTETRNLSFSLLRMVDISISLPFTFLGLLVTYLIILLQFQKVINPDKQPPLLLNGTAT